MNAHARIIQCQISVFDPPAHISMVASLKLFCFHGRMRTNSMTCIAASERSGSLITTDRILEDLTLEERLDAMVDRAMRRLAK